MNVHKVVLVWGSGWGLQKALLCPIHLLPPLGRSTRAHFQSWVNSSPAKSQLTEIEFDGGLYRAGRDYRRVDGFLFSFRVHQEIQEKEGLLENQYVTCRVWINADYISQGASKK